LFTSVFFIADSNAAACTVKAKIHYTSPQEDGNFPVASPQQVRSWRGQKSFVSVVACPFPNSITMKLLRICWPCR